MTTSAEAATLDEIARKLFNEVHVGILDDRKRNLIRQALEAAYAVALSLVTPKLLFCTGARVNSVDEEGNIHLFLYKHQESFDFRLPYGSKATVKEWAARIGDFVTLEIHDQKCEAEIR